MWDASKIPNIKIFRVMQGAYDMRKEDVSHERRQESATAVPVLILNPLQIEVGDEVRGNIGEDGDEDAEPVVHN